jgi:hypothetical protein
VGWYSVVGITACSALDVLRIDSRWWWGFVTPFQNFHGAHPASYTRFTWSFPGAKRARRGVAHLPSCSSGVKERVKLCLHSPCMSSWNVRGWPLPLSLLLLSRWFRYSSRTPRNVTEVFQGFLEPLGKYLNSVSIRPPRLSFPVRIWTFVLPSTLYSVRYNAATSTTKQLSVYIQQPVARSCFTHYCEHMSLFGFLLVCLETSLRPGRPCM